MIVGGSTLSYFQAGGRCSSFLGHVPGKVGNGSPLAQFPRSFMVQFPGKVGDGSPLPHFPGRRSFIVQYPGKVGDGSPLPHFPGRRRGKSRAAEACRWQRRLVQPAAGGL